jgi:hypothetical protein
MGVLVLLLLVVIASRMMIDGGQSSRNTSRAAVLTVPPAPDISGWRVQPAAAQAAAAQLAPAERAAALPVATAPVASLELEKITAAAEQTRQKLLKSETASPTAETAREARVAPVTAEPASPAPAVPDRVVASVAPPASTPVDRAPQPQEESFDWPEAAVKCPRTWIAGRDSAASGDTGLACHEFGTLPETTATPDLEAAAEAAAPVEVARLPLARPANPPKIAAASKTRSGRATRVRGGGLGPPPNCGSKRARWRYTDRKQGTRAWFCK